MQREELERKIASALEAFYTKEESGLFYDEIYLDYRDELSEDSVRKILSSQDPKSAFYETVQSAYELAILEAEGRAEMQLRQDPELDLVFEENEVLFRDVLCEQFYIKYPDDHFLDTSVEINIVLDTGDCNYDFVHNAFAHSYYGDREDEVDNSSSLLWLCRQQGISKEELENALRTGEYYPSDISSVMEQHAKTLSAMKNLGYIPGKPMDHYNQKGEFKTLLKAEHTVSDLEKKIRKCQNNLADCELTYEAFCEKWLSIRNRLAKGDTPPSREHWTKLRDEAYKKNTEQLALFEGQLAEAKDTLRTCLQDPNIQMAVALRDRLREINEQYVPMLHSEAYEKGQFLESVIIESANVTSHMNALTALVKMSLREAIELSELIYAEEPLNNSYYPAQRKGKSSISLGKDTVLGLYSPWQGAGSLFEIKLAGPLELPIHLIHDANVDGSLGYGIQSIYGGLDYEESLIAINNALELDKVPLEQRLQVAKDYADKSGDIKDLCLSEALNENDLKHVNIDLGREVVRQMGNGFLTEPIESEFRTCVLQDHPEWQDTSTYDMATVLFHDYCQRLDMNMSHQNHDPERS